MLRKREIIDGDAEFAGKVFRAELDEIHKRREALFANASEEWASTSTPTTKNDLIGLALSGGGIRSATFSLGVVQALAQHGLLKYVDYLSTVSGGGYIGACLSSLLNAPGTGTNWANFPFRHELGKDEPEEVKHLRASGRYIAPGGTVDFLRIPMLLLRGVLLNLLTIFPYIVLAVWLTATFVIDKNTTPSTFTVQNWYHLTAYFGIALFLWIFLSPIITRFFRGEYEGRNLYGRSFAWGLVILLAIFAIESLPPLLFYYNRLVEDQTWVGKLTLASLFSFALSGKLGAWVDKLKGKIGLFLLGLLGPAIMLLLYLQLGVWAIYDRPPFFLEALDIRYLYYSAAVIFLYTTLFVDVNETSMHTFYRDRLSNAYLLQRSADGALHHNDDLKLSQLNAEGSVAPYHLINAALNLPDVKEPMLRGRKADFFIFSKHFTGSTQTGYVPTTAVESIERHLDLGTAMAISGAAAAPNMGTATIKSLVFIMTVLNIRLGYWLPNPYHLNRRSPRRLVQFFGVGTFYLLKELLSRIHDRSWFINLSDGGHIENMGAYELLRRRCKFIIIADGESDRMLQFGGLAKLIRYARIDLGITIDIDLDRLRRGDDGLCRQHCAAGQIHYRNNEKGFLLYIKATLTGDENAYVKEYHGRKPDFPHETTADQFFDEGQFEAYRSLGFHIANRVIRNERLKPQVDALSTSNERQDLQPLFDDLQVLLHEN